MENTVICTVFSIVIYKGKFNSKWSKYTKFAKLSRGTSYKKLKLPGFCEKPYKTKIKINLYHHKNPGKLCKKFQSASAAQNRPTDFCVYTIKHGW